MVKKRGGQRKLSGRHSACFTIDARTAAALEALVDAGVASKSEAVRRAVALLAEMEIPAWRYKPPVDPRQLELDVARTCIYSDCAHGGPQAGHPADATCGACRSRWESEGSWQP